ncbi:tyrosine-type recombinase/integrase [Rhizobium leguminosarum]|uniref:tyrosine-type recombinase/integrase n=1 Tax=Rhizobium leguminosarum TaxID=384 RepID=UPI001AE43E4E|nr:site-specific integrase [Rhizobium leguminosarum]MBP2446468.1 site-specific recombinase XerD [Rhizobium leguminosarum]
MRSVETLWDEGSAESKFDADFSHPVHRIKSLNDPTAITGIPDDVTLLFDREFKPLTEMNLFILSHAKDRRNLYNTANGYADDLANYEMYCDYKGITWRDATTSDMEFYHSILSSGVSWITRKTFAPSTIARRIGTVKHFYKFCINKGFICDSVSSPHRYKGNSSRGTKAVKVKFINLQSLRQILTVLGPSPEEKTASPTRDRTVAEYLFLIGGRLEDAVALTLTDVLNWELELRERPDRFLVEHTVVGKGDVKRTVLVPRPLVSRIIRYIETTRAQIIELALKIKGPAWAPPNNVFLNGVQSNHRDVGNAASADTLGRAFVEGVRKAGVLKAEDRVLFGTDGKPIRERGSLKTEIMLAPKHSIHHLRHTFVAVIADGLRRHGNSSPFKVIQMLLGHSWLSTTVDTYGGSLALDEPDIADAFEAVLRSYNFHEDDG